MKKFIGNSFFYIFARMEKLFEKLLFIVLFFSFSSLKGQVDGSDAHVHLRNKQIPPSEKLGETSRLCPTTHAIIITSPNAHHRNGAELLHAPRMIVERMVQGLRTGRARAMHYYQIGLMPFLISLKTPFTMGTQPFGNIMPTDSLRA